MIAAFALLGCGGSPPPPAPAPEPPAPVATPVAPSAPKAVPPPSTAGRVRFLAIGDTGTRTADQKRVAEAMAKVCAQKSAPGNPGCDFVVLLGDNVYPEGIEGPDDPLMVQSFEEPYAGLDLTFYAVLGNHDWGRGALEREQADHEVAYSAKNPKFQLPAHTYQFSAGEVDFFALDTNAAMIGDDPAQLGWIREALRASGARWKVVLGHHPLLSNGPHGNAGSYEGTPLVPIVSGQGVRELLEGGVCSAADIYLCGHDHSRQWLNPSCGLELVVSGAGARVSSLPGRGNTAFYEDATQAGFFWFEIVGDTLVGEAYDIEGQLDFTRTAHKSRPDR